MQIDFDAHEFARGDRWKDPQENILYGCKVLAQCLGMIKRKVAAGFAWTAGHDALATGFGAAAAGSGDDASCLGNVASGYDAVTSAVSAATGLVVAFGPGDREILRAALASYNAGPGRILKAFRESKGIDYYTTGRNYSSDVLNRAGWFQLHGWA
jgi:hypothetical protein